MKGPAWPAALLLALFYAAAFSQHSQAQPQALSKPPAFAPDRVLVKFRPGTAAADIASAHRAAGASPVKTLPGIGTQLVRVPAGSVPARVAAYRRNPNVAYAEPDYYRVLVIPSEEPGPTPAGGASFFDEQWYLHNVGQWHTEVVQTIFGPVLNSTQGSAGADIDAPAAWDLRQGIATTSATDYHTPKVAVLDSGADCDSLELAGKCLEQVNLVGLNPGLLGLDPCTAAKPACDNLGHGTFVASELGANTDNGEGIAGVGWHTGFGVFKVCYQELVTDGINVFTVGLCPLSGSAEAIALAASDQLDAGGNLVRSQYHVITMSYGSDLIDETTGEITPSSPPNTECDAVLYAWNNGVVVVAAAGNNGDTTKFYPAACTDQPETGDGNSTVIAVAASDHDDNRASFSTHSSAADPWVSLAAPGQAVVGILPDAQCGIAPGSDSCVHWLDGTSMAAPLVAGGAALLWSDLYLSGEVDGDPAPALCTVGGLPCNQVVRNRLESSADSVGALGQDLLQWTRHGRLNLAAALAEPPPPPPPPPPPGDELPTAAFSYNCSGLDCSFDAGASSDDNGIVSYSWDFGDGSAPGSGAAPSHLYAAPGNYVVTLTVTDTVGQSDDATASVAAKTKGKSKGDSGGSDGGDSGDGGGGNCPPAKAAKGKC